MPNIYTPFLPKTKKYSSKGIRINEKSKGKSAVYDINLKNNICIFLLIIKAKGYLCSDF
jgi:hypothetical protein